MLGLQPVRLGILIGLLAVVSNAAQAADDVSKLTQRLNQCRQDVIDYRQAGSDADEMLAGARAGKLILIPRMGGGVAVDPKTYAQFLMLKWATKQITKEDLRRGTRNIAAFTKAAVQTLAQMKADAAEALNDSENECGRLAEQLKIATSTSASSKPAMPPATTTPAQSNQGWVSQGTGDCSGRDVDSSSGLLPDPGKCTAANAGMAAVCWDGRTHKNAYGEAHGAPDYPWCTYKSAGSCGGGSNTGKLYYCRP